MKEKRVVMKLILICSKWFGKFVPNVELPLLYRGYCIKFMVFGKELEVQEIPGMLLHVWAGFRSRQGFPGHDKVFWFCIATGVPCVTAWFSCFMQFPCHDIFLPCRDSVFLLYRYNVVTDVSFSRP